MGANASLIQSDKETENYNNKPKRLEDIPESCVALVLCYLDPPEICKLARVNRSFRAASSADFIWDPKLPSNYLYILQNILNEDVNHLCKKDIYSKLARPTSFDNGRKEVWIDKKTGGVCLAIAAKAMTITGIDDRRYWNHIPTEESRFHTIAYLQQIWWLEVDGDLEFQLPPGKYSLFFRLQLGRVTKRLGRRVCNSESIHGWDIKPVQFKLTTADGQSAISRYFLDNLGSWEHYHVGDFVVETPDTVSKIKFSLTQIDCTHTKGGLCVDSALICPSSLGKDFKSSL